MDIVIRHFKRVLREADLYDILSCYVECNSKGKVYIDDLSDKDFDKVEEVIEILTRLINKPSSL
jgi:hypothetical protein